MSEAFIVDDSVELPEFNRRLAYEKTIGGKFPALMSIDNIDRFMKLNGYFQIHDFSDGSIMYAAEGADNTEIYFQRDWAKFGFIRAPYHMYISLGAGVQYFFRVCSIKKINRVISWWKKRHASPKPTKKANQSLKTGTGEKEN